MIIEFEATILKCPICGRHPIIKAMVDIQTAYITCPICGIETPVYLTLEEANEIRNYCKQERMDIWSS